MPNFKVLNYMLYHERSIENASEALDLHPNTVSDVLGEEGVVQCSGCGTWANAIDLYDMPDTGKTECWTCRNER